MANPINSTEQALAILHKKLIQFADELINSGESLSEESKNVIKKIKDFANLDADQQEKILELIGNKFFAQATSRLWLYGGFLICFVIIALLFIYIGYFKLYKPMAEREQKQIEKKLKKDNEKKKKKKQK